MRLHFARSPDKASICRTGRSRGTACKGIAATLCLLAPTAGCSDNITRRFAPHGRYSYVHAEPEITTDKHLALLQAGYANIGEIALSAPAEVTNDELLERMLREARFVGGERLRIEDALRVKERGYIEGNGACTVRGWAEKSSTFCKKAGDCITTTWKEKECVRRADVEALVDMRILRGTVWRASPASAQQLAKATTDVPVTKDPGTTENATRLMCRAGRPTSCERAALRGPSKQKAVFQAEAVRLHTQRCAAGLPASCAAAKRLSRKN